MTRQDSLSDMADSIANHLKRKPIAYRWHNSVTGEDWMLPPEEVDVVYPVGPDPANYVMGKRSMAFQAADANLMESAPDVSWVTFTDARGRTQEPQHPTARWLYDRQEPVAPTVVFPVGATVQRLGDPTRRGEIFQMVELTELWAVVAWFYHAPELVKFSQLQALPI